MTDTAQMLTIRIPLRVRKRGGRKTMIAPDVLAMPASVDVALVKALARAHRWRRMLEAGEHGMVRELARAEKVNETYISRALRLSSTSSVGDQLRQRRGDAYERVVVSEAGAEITLNLDGIAAWPAT